MLEDDSKVLPPHSPVTVKLNMAVLDFVFWQWVKRYFVGYDVTLTSAYRPLEKNSSVGGAANSAHLHGLAYDFVFSKNGKTLTLEQAHDIYNELIAPTWPGFTLFEVKENSGGKKVWHVHVNLDRNITTYMGLAGASVVGVLGYKILKGLGFKI